MTRASIAGATRNWILWPTHTPIHATGRRRPTAVQRFRVKSRPATAKMITRRPTLRMTICEMVARWAPGSLSRPVRYATYGGPPRAEQRTQYPAHDASRRRPYPTELPRRAPAENDVEGMEADEDAQGEERDAPGKLHEQRYAQGEAQKGEGHQEQELARIGLPSGLKAEHQRRGEVEHRGQRQHKCEGKKVGENRDGDGRCAESSDAEDDIPDKDDERGDDEHGLPGHQASREILRLAERKHEKNGFR